MDIQKILIISLIICGSIIALATLLTTLIQTARQVKRLHTKTVTNTYDTIQFPEPISNDFLVVIKEIVYEYLADGKTIYQRKHLKLEALQGKQSSYSDRYRWTGSGSCTLKALTPG